ncbi:MAG: matrixin family metalloprotease [Planctomycetes bacterium]|nr:matrixin family metalloprotease [Planctomycetota bacterium]
MDAVMRQTDCSSKRATRPLSLDNPLCRRRTFQLLALALSLGLILTGCNSMGGTTGGGSPAHDASERPTDGNQDSATAADLNLKDGEPNDGFESALSVIYNDNRAELQGTITGGGDIDVFILEAMEPGDRIEIDVDTFGSGLDSAIAVYDDQGRLFADNDDRSGSNLDSYIDAVIRHAGDPYYLAVSATFFPFSSSAEDGGYWITVDITPGGSVPDPVAQVLFLDFDGGTLTNPDLIDVNDSGNEIRPFSGASIAPFYADHTDTIKQSIIDTLAENFEGLGVELVSSDDGVPDVVEFSTIMFGSRSQEAFGISESVDSYNSDPSDMAVIFTESFSPFVFRSIPRPVDLGMAIGNVAAHEAGHLLGLNHVEDPLAIMDAASPADTFLDDQDFKEAPLSPQIMDLGTQDALLLLGEILGID